MKRTLAKAVRGAASNAAIIVSLCIITMAAHAQPAQAQPVCAPRDAIAEGLASGYGERVTAAGVDQRGNLIEVFSSDTGTWTIVLTIPGGPACLLSSGDGWQYMQVELPSAERHSS